LKYVEELFAVLYGFEAQFLTLREVHRLRMFENRVLRRMFGLRWRNSPVTGENCTIRGFMVYISCHILSGWSNKEVGWADNVAEWKRRDVYRVLVGNLKVSSCVEDLDIEGGGGNIKMDLSEPGWGEQEFGSPGSV
jgi:hypothetical protein